MYDLDGAGAGGQFLRSALALAALAGEPVRVRDVRGGRSNPGLRPQHLAVVELLRSICDAEVGGAEEGSETVTFDPGEPAPGNYEADIGTAGSIWLLFDAVLPLASLLDGPLTVRATGGTDVKWAPTTAHYRGVKLPVLRAHGVAAAVDLERPGYYPVGGGGATLGLWPSAPTGFRLESFTAPAGVAIVSHATPELGDADVASRQLRSAADALPAEVDVTERTVRYGRADSPGSAVAVLLRTDQASAGFDAVGERGRPAEEVGAEAGEAAARFIGSGAAVDRHLADQLLLPLATAGGAVAVPGVTDHVRSSIELLDAFGYEVSIDRDGSVPVLRSG